MLLKLALTIIPLVACIQTNVYDIPIYDDDPSVEWPYPDHPEIYRIDGVEYVDRTRRNLTLRALFKEDFFNNVQDNFINGFARAYKKYMGNLSIMEDKIFTAPHMGDVNVTVN